MMPSCREVSRWVAEGSLEGAPPFRRFLVSVHLLMCRHCRLYVSQIRSIGRAARAYAFGAVGRIEGLENLEQRIIETITRSDGGRS